VLKRFAYFYHLFFALNQSFVGALAHHAPIGRRHQILVHLVYVGLLHAVFRFVGDLENETFLLDVKSFVHRLHGEESIDIIGVVPLLLFFIFVIG